MKLEVRRPVLETLCVKAASVLPSKALLPILQNFHISVMDDLLYVVATDLELSVVSTTTLVTCEEAGEALIPGRKLLEMVKSCDDAPVHIDTAGQAATVSCAGALWTINLMQSGDFPDVPYSENPDVVEVPRKTFISALQRVKGAAAKEGVRPALQMLDLSGGYLRASDGTIFRQVYMVELSDMDMQIPLGAVEDLIKWLRSSEVEHIAVGQTEDHLFFIVGSDYFIVTKTNVDYPDVEQSVLTPARQNVIRLSVDRQQLLNGVKRMRLNSNLETKGVTLLLSANELRITARNTYGETGEQVLEAHYGGAPRSLGVNHESLIDVLQAVDSSKVDIMLGVDNGKKHAPIFIKDGDVEAVLQQLKVGV
jgi:DNA polymerase III subunit beta